MADFMNAEGGTAVEIDEIPIESAGKTNNARPPLVKNIIRGFVLVLVAAAVVVGFRYWVFVSSHAVTDDAYITTNVIQISPQVSGTVIQVRVKDNQLVKKGELLLALDDSTFRAAVAEAQANLNAAIAQAQGAGVNIDLTTLTSNAQITQAQGGVGQAEGSIAGARATVAQAQAGIESAIANKSRAQAAINAARAAVASARANVSTAQAAVSAAQANYDNAARDAHRFATLVSQGAEAEQKSDQATTSAAAAKAALDGAREQVTAAQAVVSSKQADLAAAQDQLAANNAIIAQSNAQFVAAQQGVRQATARQTQATGQLSQARTAPTQVKVSRNVHQQALARVQQAQAALQAAQIQLGYTRIFAPVAGCVNNKTVEVGELLQPGNPLMALVPQHDLWVVANFKETQMPGIVPGRKASVTVDSAPEYTFTGHVDSIAAGTGATFALLPPENATGNFTKVVQRIPVKIILDPGQPGLDRLSTGMSVIAVVKTK